LDAVIENQLAKVASNVNSSHDISASSVVVFENGITRPN
jgi:hypothetical protein